MIQVLNHYKDREIIISEDLLVAGAQSQNEEMMDLLLNHAGRIMLTEDILTAATRGLKKGNKILQLLLNHPACNIKVSQELLHTILYSTLSEEVSFMLLRDYQGDLPITSGIFKATLEHGSHLLLSLILGRPDKSRQIPEEVLEQVVQSNFGEESFPCS
ncbi:hypothetical protein BDW62DRAFT_27019 [Aspergillus aurantiobrunneus]